MVLTGNVSAGGSASDFFCNVTMTGDANFTVPAAAATAFVLKVSTLTNLTATRNIVLPLTPAVYFVDNSTGGAQSIQVIGASGTGITIATAKKALVYCDGTNFIRATADV